MIPRSCKLTIDEFLPRELWEFTEEVFRQAQIEARKTDFAMKCFLQVRFLEQFNGFEKYVKLSNHRTANKAAMNI